METNPNNVVRNYCAARGINFLTYDELQKDWGGPEEWEGVSCAGLDEHGTVYIICESNGRIKLVTAWADGLRRIQDTWTPCTAEQVERGQIAHAE